MSYAYWLAALAAKKNGTAPPVAVVDQPEWGFYRSPRRGDVPLPLAIWSDGSFGLHDDDALCGRLGSKEISRDRLNEVWMFACGHPITEEVYRAVAERGEPWPDIDATVNDHLAAGHNSAAADPLETLRQKIDIAAGGADKYETIADDDAMTRAQTLRARLMELSGTADKHCEDEYRPHKVAADAVKTKWSPLMAVATAAAKRIKAAMDAYGTRKFQAAEAQRRAVEDEQRKAVEAQRKAAEAGEPAPPPPPPSPPAPAAAPAKIKGATGRAASGRMVKVVKSITDYALCYAYVADQPEVRASIMEAAQRLTTAGQNVPGTEVKEEMKYR